METEKIFFFQMHTFVAKKLKSTDFFRSKISVLSLF